MEKNRKIFVIIGMAIAIPIIIVLLILLFKDNNVMNLIDIEDESSIKANKIDVYIVSKNYNVEKSQIKEARDVYKLGKLSGKLLLIRSEDFSANMFQSYYDTTNGISSIPVIVQIDQYMESFINNVEEKLGIDSNYEYTEALSGESKYKFSIATEESIYTEGRTYTRNYIVNNRKYDMNFYMDDDVLVCEFVRLF